MKVNNEDIEQVLALFDKEDIPFININYLVEKGLIEFAGGVDVEEEGPVLKLGGNNDGQR